MRGPSTTARREPAINVPTPLLVWIGLLVAIHAMRALALGEQADGRLILDGAFVPAQWSIALGWWTPDDVVRSATEAAAGTETESIRPALAQYLAALPLRPWSAVSYSLLHGSWLHVGVNCLWLLAFGALVLRRAGVGRCLVLWVVTAVGGALAQWMADPAAADIVIGASASVSGFMAAAATFMYRKTAPERWGFVRDRNVLVFLGIWLAANLVFGLLAKPMGLSEGEIAWRAHVGGLLAALLVFPLLDPGAAARRGAG